MPAPGEQHSRLANPYENEKQRITEFTAAEIATLQARLEKQLGPEYLSSRAGPSGQKVHYIAAEKCIALANEVFGFNGWSSSIQNVQVDFVDENPQTMKISLGLSVIVRVTLKDGTYHEDIGYGHIENCKGKAAAFEKAKKEGTTDALKRALRSFGNVLGNCIYDKDYLAKVTKMKVGPTKFDEDSLHRHNDFIKKEYSGVKLEVKAVAAPESNPSNASGVFGSDDIDWEDADLLNVTVLPDSLALEEDFGDFDIADFGVTEDGHPDEVVLPGTHEHGNNSSEKSQNLFSGKASDRDTPPVTGPGSRPIQPASRPVAQPHKPPQTPNQRPSAPYMGRPSYPPNQPNKQLFSAASRPSTGMGAPGGANEPATFFSARSVKDVPESADPGTAVIVDQGAKLFDPRAESPSIRKTPGIDHRTSKPVSRSGVHVEPVKRDYDSVQKAPPTIPPNVVNPSLSQVRQIGAPGGGGSPLGNRGQYRPLTMKRPAPGGGPTGGGNRTPLTEVSPNPPAGVTGVGVDAKRQKTA